MPDAVLEVYLEHLLIMKKDELRVVQCPACTQRCLQRTKSIDSEFQCMYKLGESSAGDHSRVPESRDCSRNRKEPLADDARSCCCSKQNAAVQ